MAKRRVWLRSYQLRPPGTIGEPYRIRWVFRKDGSIKVVRIPIPPSDPLEGRRGRR